MLKVNRLEAEKAKKEGLKFPCDKCDNVAAAPGNLKTHKMANHDGVKFMERYADDYFDKDDFLLWFPQLGILETSLQQCLMCTGLLFRGTIIHCILCVRSDDPDGGALSNVE
jgi:hypothetical protein